MKPLLLLVVLLMALSPLSAAAADWSHAEPVTVVASEYQFSPNRLVFRHGVAYRLKIENHGKEQHEFTAPAFFKAVELGNPDVLNADKTEIEIPPGTTKDLYFTAPRPGHFDLRCSDHDWAGMTGEITIK